MNGDENSGALDGNSGSPWPPCAEQALGVVRPVGREAGPQQREVDQVVLRAAAADALVLARERRQRLDRRGIVATFERGEPDRQGGKVLARRVAALGRQGLDLAGPR